MECQIAIETKGLTKVYRGLWRRREVRAVEGVSLNVERGTTFGLLGPNGAGKTTFVKMLLSAVHPTSGEARIFGRPANQAEARRPIGYLPENHRFPTYFTGAGMLDCYAALSGVTAAERRRRIPELLALVGLEEWGGVRLGKYSKGMLQRVGLAQAILHKPRLLILDEPSDGVDPVGRRQIREILHRLEEDGVTVFINSHLLVEVELLCREVAILHKGKLALQGMMKDLTAGKGYRVRAAAGSANLIETLRERAVSLAANDGRVEAQFASIEAANEAIDLLRAARVIVESVTPTTSTLEEVFMKTVEGDAHA